MCTEHKYLIIIRCVHCNENVISFHYCNFIIFTIITTPHLPNNMFFFNFNNIYYDYSYINIDETNVWCFIRRSWLLFRSVKSARFDFGRCLDRKIRWGRALSLISNPRRNWAVLRSLHRELCTPLSFLSTRSVGSLCDGSVRRRLPLALSKSPLCSDISSAARFSPFRSSLESVRSSGTDYRSTFFIKMFILHVFKRNSLIFMCFYTFRLGYDRYCQS